jgi:hypothetical protein
MDTLSKCHILLSRERVEVMKGLSGRKATTVMNIYSETLRRPRLGTLLLDNDQIEIS